MNTTLLLQVGNVREHMDKESMLTGHSCQRCRGHHLQRCADEPI